MTLTDDEVAEHNRLYDQATHLVERDIIMDGQPLSAKPGLFARFRLRKGLGLFDEVLRLNPENWPAIFMKGKIHQRLGDQPLALELMLKAYRGNPSLTAFAREAGLVASQLGHHQQGIELTEAAIRLSPDKGGLYSNLGLMHLFNGNASEASRSFQRAVTLEPDYPMTPRLLVVARAAQAGTIGCPKTEAELGRAVRRIAKPS